MAGTGKTLIIKKNMVPAFMEFMVHWDTMERSHIQQEAQRNTKLRILSIFHKLVTP